MNFNSRTSTKGLKKVGDNLWYDKTSDSTFRKNKNGKLEMQVDDFERKMHKQTMERIRYYEKKYNTTMQQARDLESRRWKEYTDSVKKWNKGEISRANTVGRKRKAVSSYQKDIRRYYRAENKQLASDMREKKKVFAMRTRGIKDIKNGKVYDDFIDTVAKRLKVDNDTIESMLFPKGIEEASKYDEMKEIMDTADDRATYTIEDLIEDSVQQGIITEEDAFFLLELIYTGEEL